MINFRTSLEAGFGFLFALFEEACQLVARAFVGVGGFAAQCMHRAADVGVVTAVELVHRADHLHRFLQKLRQAPVEDLLYTDPV